MDHSLPKPEFYKAPLDIYEYHGMPYMRLGNSGLWAPRVGLGTWKFGRPETGDEARVDQAAALRLFDRALELGVTFWDTAPRYNNASGNSERVIGEWFKSNPDQRRNIIIATKVYGGMDGLTPNHCRLTRGNLKESVYASLERMQIDVIDLLYFHHYDPITPPEETFSALEDLVEDDLVRYLAVSNFTIEQLSSTAPWKPPSAPARASWRCRTSLISCAANIPITPGCLITPPKPVCLSLPTAPWRKVF